MTLPRRPTSRLRLLLLASLACPLLATAAGMPPPTCSNGDGLTPIASWQPTIDDEAYITTEPPYGNGELVYIRATYKPSPESPCDDATLHPLALRNTDGEPGGLSVNVKGHTSKTTDGSCTFDGVYRNEDVPGMHQGWIETYFGAVDAPAGHCIAPPTAR